MASLLVGLAGASGCRAQADPDRLLNVSYDPTRELYQELNPVFVAQWKEKTGREITIEQSHGGAGKQARAVIDGVAGGGASNGALAFGPFRRVDEQGTRSDGRAAAYVRTVDLAVQRRPNGLPHALAVVSEIRRVGALVRVELAVEGLARPLVADLAVHEQQALQLAAGEQVYAAIRDARVFEPEEPVARD